MVKYFLSIFIFGLCSFELLAVVTPEIKDNIRKREEASQGRLTKASLKFRESLNDKVTKESRIKHAKEAKDIALAHILNSGNKKDAKPISKATILELFSGIQDTGVLENIARSMAILQVVSCSKIATYDSLSFHQIQSASAIYLASVIRYQRDYTQTLKELEVEFEKNQNKDTITIDSVEYEIDIKNEEVDFQEKLLVVGNVLVDFYRWVTTSGKTEMSDKYSKINIARQKKDKYHDTYKKEEKRARASGQPHHARKAHIAYNKYKDWKARLAEAKLHTHLGCTEDIQPVGEETTFIDFFFSNAHASDAQAIGSATDFYNGMQAAQAKEFSKDFVIPENRIKYLAEIIGSLSSSNNSLSNGISKGSQEITSMNKLRTDLKNRYEKGSEGEEVGFGKSIVEAGGSSSFENEFGMSAEALCRGCLDVSIGTLSGSDYTGGILNSTSVGKNALAASYKKSEKRLSLKDKFVKSVKLNIEGDGTINELPAFGDFKEIVSMRGTYDPSAKPDTKETKEPRRVVIVKEVEEKITEKTKELKQKVEKKKNKFLGFKDEKDVLVGEKELKEVELAEREELEEDLEHGDMGSALGDEEAFEKEVTLNRSLPIWVIISNRYRTTGFERLLKRKELDD